MVRKEDFCDWFQALPARKRIDYMCGLLHMCLPMELRFIGTVLEDLAKKDFHSLRDQEIKANQTTSLSSNNPSSLVDASLRAKILSALALLNSTNSSCSEIIFNILKREFDNLFEMLHDQRIAEEINLILTMAVHHPAFQFYQKTQLGDVLKTVEGRIQDLYGDDKIDLTLPSQPLTPEATIQTGSVISSQSSAASQAEKVTVKAIEVKGARQEPQNKRGGSEYRIHTTWSNGEITEVYLKYKQLQELHHKVLMKYPEERKSHKYISVFPGKHKHTTESLEDQIASLNAYLSQLVKAPAHILNCEIWIEPLRSGTLVRQAVTFPSSTTPMSTASVVVNAPLQQDSVYIQGSPLQEDRCCDFNSIPRYGYSLYNTAYPGMVSHAECSPGQLQLSSTTNSPSNSRTSSPAPLISHAGVRSNYPPQAGVKVLPMGVPQPNRELQLHQLLQLLGLDQYYENLKEFSVKQIFAMSKEDFAKAGLPNDAQVKLRSKLDLHQQSHHDINGIDYSINRISSTEVQAHFPTFYVMAPPIYPQFAYTAPASHASVLTSPDSHVQENEVSPVNSEASSPPPSPLLAGLSLDHGQGSAGSHGHHLVGLPHQMMSPPAAVAADSLSMADVKLLKKVKGQHLDSSGSEEDKGVGQGHEKVKGHSRPQQSQSLPHINPSSALVSAMDEAKLSVMSSSMSAPPHNHPILLNNEPRTENTPPPHSLSVPAAAPSSQMSTSPGIIVNGYISDPPPIPPQGAPTVMPRTILNARPYKQAQPTHTGPLHKNVINMPFDISHPPHSLVKNGGGPLIHGHLPMHSFMGSPIAPIPSAQVMGVSPANLQANNNTIQLGPQQPPPPSLVTEGGSVYPPFSLFPQLSLAGPRGILTTIANSTAIITTTQSHSIVPPLSHSPSPVATAVCADQVSAASFMTEVVEANRQDGPSLTPPHISAFKTQTNISGPNSGTPSPPLIQAGPKQPGNTVEAFAGRGAPSLGYWLLPANGFMSQIFSHPQQGHQAQQQPFPNGLTELYLPRFPTTLPPSQIQPYLYGNSVYPPHSLANSASTISNTSGLPPTPSHNHSGGGLNPKTACYTCGQAGHKGAECKENTMENMSNTFRLNINKPKSDSE